MVIHAFSELFVQESHEQFGVKLMTALREVAAAMGEQVRAC
jgi:hypothetical protein